MAARKRKKKDETLGDRARRLREALPDSPSPERLVQLHAEAGVSAQVIRKLERGIVWNPRLTTLLAIAKLVGLERWEEQSFEVH